MAPAKLIWRGGGPASVMAGILLATGQITNLFRGDPQFSTVLGGNLILLAHVLLIFALITLYMVRSRTERGPGTARHGDGRLGHDAHRFNRLRRYRRRP